MFIELNNKKEIIRSSNFKFDNSIKTDKEIVRGFDGKLYFKGDEPEIDIKYLQEEKIKQLKENCSNYIYSIYPIHKQLNIINPLSDFPEEKIIEMNEFLDLQRIFCNEKEVLINEATTAEELEAIEIVFNK